MALDLSFSVVERNDNLRITITDTTGTYDAGSNAGGWGAPNLVVGNITATGGAQPLELSITITTSNGTETTYDDIDLFTEFGAPALPSDLVFALDCSMLISDGTALGTDEDEFPDGVYEFTYIYDQGLGSEITEVVKQVIKGKVQNDVYYLLRAMATSYECTGCINDGILLAIFTKTYLDSLDYVDLDARPTSALNQIYTLERLLINIPTYEF